MTEELISYREIIEKDGTDLDDIFYVSSFVRLWHHSNAINDSYIITVQQSGSGRDYFTKSYATLEDAQKAYGNIKGSLAFHREKRK